MMGHTILLDHANKQGLWVANSLKQWPEYLIKWDNIDQIERIDVIRL